MARVELQELESSTRRRCGVVDATLETCDNGKQGNVHTLKPSGGNGMRQFKWIEWNLGKIEAHALTPKDIEASFNRVYQLRERKDGSFEMYAETPSGRRIWVIWRYDREDEEIPDIYGELGEVPIFVITAY